MTADRRAALVKKVATLINSMSYFWSMDLSLRQAEKTAHAAIDLIRADVLEEAARELERFGGLGLAAKIRALAAPSGALKQGDTFD